MDGRTGVWEHPSVVVHPRSVPVLDRARAYFDQFAGAYDAAATEAGWLPNEILADDLAPGPLLDGDPVIAALDLGCGTGRTLAVLRRAFPFAELVGVDCSSAMLAIARNRVPRTRYVGADIADFAAAADREYDLVTAIGGFEFVADLPSVLDGVRSLVRPGGHLVLTFEPVVVGWPPQAARIETNLGDNGLELTTVRWEPGEVDDGFRGWTQVNSRLIVAYRRDGLPTLYGWRHYRRPD
jgi:SAM-dependent methyltransferase